MLHFFFSASVIFCNFKKFLIAITEYYFCIFDVKVIAKKKNHHKLNGYTISFESTCTHLYMYQRMCFSAIINS